MKSLLKLLVEAYIERVSPDDSEDAGIAAKEFYATLSANEISDWLDSVKHGANVVCDSDYNFYIEDEEDE